MAVLHVEPGQPMSILAEAAVLPAASLTRHVDKLVERGWSCAASTRTTPRRHRPPRRRYRRRSDRRRPARGLEAELADYFQMEIHERSGSATRQ